MCTLVCWSFEFVDEIRSDAGVAAGKQLHSMGLQQNSPGLLRLQIIVVFGGFTFTNKIDIVDNKMLIWW